MHKNNSAIVVWKVGALAWALNIAVIALLVILYKDSLILLLTEWEVSEEYNHGYLIPVISLLMIWQLKDRLEQLEFTGSWLGFSLVVFGIVLFFMGELSTLYTIVQYSLLLVLLGLVLSFAGLQAFSLFLIPLIYLAFSIPLPDFLYNNLSTELQLISSQLGVAVIRLFGISVYLDGNVIDLGNYKLQVVEACSGLRYLFPLMGIAFLCAYLFKQSWWKRVIIFVSSIPITVLMNSFRIGAIGVLVENWGNDMADGFLHDFEGWVIFSVCLLILLLEMWILTKIGRDRRPLSEIIVIHFPSITPQNALTRRRRIPLAYITACLFLVMTVGFASFVTERKESELERKSLSDFPMTLGKWSGTRNPLEKIYRDALKMSDYMLANYVAPENSNIPVNFYVAYYDSQRKGESAHSPRSCIPGDGWEIQGLTQHTIGDAEYRGKSLTVNRLQIQKGNDKQLVYYWFQQRGRIITNEYSVKWYLFQDGLARNRTDGALVRLTTIIPFGMDIESGDKRLSDFARSVISKLDDYIPE